MLGKKSPKSEKYISFKPYLIHRTAQVTTKMRRGAVLVFANSNPHRTAPHRTAHVTVKMRCDAVMILPKPHRKVQC